MTTVGGYLDVLAAANAAPDAKDWAAEFSRYTIGVVAERSAATIQTLVDAGVHLAAPVSYEDATVTAADDQRVSVEVCVDSSRAELVDADGQPVTLNASGPRVVSFFKLARFAPEDGGWLILERPTPAEPKRC